MADTGRRIPAGMRTRVTRDTEAGIVRDVRSDPSVPKTAVARRYGVCKATVYNVLHRAGWPWRKNG